MNIIFPSLNEYPDSDWSISEDSQKEEIEQIYCNYCHATGAKHIVEYGYIKDSVCFTCRNLKELEAKKLKGLASRISYCIEKEYTCQSCGNDKSFIEADKEYCSRCYYVEGFITAV